MMKRTRDCACTSFSKQWWDNAREVAKWEMCCRHAGKTETRKCTLNVWLIGNMYIFLAILTHSSISITHTIIWSFTEEVSGGEGRKNRLISVHACVCVCVRACNWDGGRFPLWLTLPLPFSTSRNRFRHDWKNSEHKAFLFSHKFKGTAWCQHNRFSVSSWHQSLSGSEEWGWGPLL